MILGRRSTDTSVCGGGLVKEFREGPVVEEEVESFLADVRSTVGYDRENVLRERNRGGVECV